MESKISCVEYRNPHVNPENLMNYINLTIEQIHQVNKLSLVMGDFNIDLLGLHTLSENFINTLGSFFYLPHIQQPTRITDLQVMNQAGIVIIV